MTDELTEIDLNNCLRPKRTTVNNFKHPRLEKSLCLEKSLRKTVDANQSLDKC